MQTSFFPNRFLLIAIVGIAQMLPAEDLDVRVADGTDIAILIDFDGIRRSGADLGTIASDAIDDSVRGVPALSGPVGTTPLRQELNLQQLNLGDIIDSTIFPSWPHRHEIKWNGWLHSDIKDVAFPLVRQVFINIIDAGGQ